MVKVLLSLSLLGQAPVEPVVVSIDKFDTPNGDAVYCLADAHLGSEELVRQEHVDFLEAVKSKENACVIGEDMSYYDESDYRVEKFIDSMFKRSMPEVVLPRNSALENGARSCREHTVPFYNAECRHEVVYNSVNSVDSKDGHDNLIATVEPFILGLKQYNIDWIKFYSRWHISTSKKYIQNGMNTWASNDQKKLKAYNFENEAVDISILHGLHHVLQDSSSQPEGSWFMRSKVDDSRKKNVFIFAGATHINRIVSTLEKYFKFTKSAADKHRKFSSDRFDVFEEKERRDEQDFIENYAVNITDFFALEKDQEKEQESASPECP